jgi:hypothetical protein
MSLQRRTLQETTTALSAADVLAAAREFFSRRNSIYAAYVEQESAHHLSMRGQGGEEIAIGVTSAPGGTRVSCASYMFDAQIGRFLGLLPPANATEAA